MTLKNMNDEYICDFFVSAEKKRANVVYLDLLREFDQLCKRANLTYWVGFGALLGAVRHKGFIPWDDDMDIIMPRKDFDRLQAMTQSDFGTQEPYFIQNYTTDPTCIQTLMRFRRSDTTDIREYDFSVLAKHNNTPTYNLGINLAIFPLDNLSPYGFIRTLQKNAAYLFRALNYRAVSPAEGKAALNMFCRMATGLIGPLNIAKLTHWVYRLCRSTRSGKVHCFYGINPTKSTWSSSDFESTVMLPFENTMISVPAGYANILADSYGNYMQFPPVEKRVEQHDGYKDPDTPYLDSIKALFGGQEPDIFNQ